MLFSGFGKHPLCIYFYIAFPDWMGIWVISVFLAVMNTVVIFVCIFLLICFYFSWMWSLRVQFLGQMIIISWGARLFITVDVPLYTPTSQQHRGILISAWHHWHLSLYSFFNIAFPLACSSAFQCGFICSSLIINIEHLPVLFCMVVFGEMPIQILHLFLNWIVFYLLCYKSSLYTQF